MSDDEAERWVTYAEAGKLLGISSEAARQMAQRRNWQRRTRNEPGVSTMVLMPMKPLPVRHRTSQRTASNGATYPIEQGQALEHEGSDASSHDQPDTAEIVRRTVELMLGVILEQLQHERGRVEEAYRRADELQARLEDAVISERIAREKASVLRDQFDHERSRATELITAERIAREEASALRTQIEALRARGWWQRIRNKP
jgi:hypothetical protein